MERIIEVDSLKKTYGHVQAVKGVSFYVEQGRLFAFLGPNGAGKSTTIDILCTLLRPDSGDVTIDGRPLGSGDAHIRAITGVVFQYGVLDPLLTVKENLYARGGFYGMSARKLRGAVDSAAAAADVVEFIDRPYGKLSGGQKRRADIARALVPTPKILFLDEPTTGLDPQTRKSIWETIQALQRDNGVTVFLTTHYMEEAAGADYVIVIDDGKIAAKGAPEELRRRYSSDTLKMHADSEAALAGLLDEADIKYARQNGMFCVTLGGTLEAIPILERCKGLITHFEVAAGSMDDTFIGITGKEMRE